MARRGGASAPSFLSRKEPLTQNTVLKKEYPLNVEEFLKDLYGGLTGYAMFATKGVLGGFDSERAFALPKDLDSGLIRRYVDLRLDQDVYCSVAVFSEPFRSKDDTEATTNVIWADADLANPDNFKAEPSIAVITSPDKWHLYWKLEAPVKAIHAQDYARRIFLAHQDDGCDAGWSLTKYLRVPGTTNRKYDDDYEIIAEAGPARYTFESLDDLYPAGEFDSVTADDEGRNLPPDLDDDELSALEHRIPYELRDLYLYVPEPGMSWTTRAMRLWCDLFRSGFTDHEVYHLACRAATNKYAPAAWGKFTQTGVVIPERRNWEEVTWKEVLLAKAKVKAEEEQVVPIVVERREVAHGEAPDFLTPKERDLIKDNQANFLVQYGKLGQTFTGSAPTYHRSLGAVLLACVYGMSGRINLPFLARNPLNLWTIIAGDSTASRKSTAYNLFRDVLSVVDKASARQTLIGADMTSEGLTAALNARDGEVSLIGVDEVSGLFHGLNNKRYLSGLRERITEMYDGRVPLTLRANKDAEVREESATSCLNMVGIGVRTAISDELTVADFQSGFLMRMTWSVDRRKGHEKGATALRFASNHGDSIYKSALERDSAVNDIGERLFERLAPFQQRDTPVYLDLTKEAEDRFNEWAERAQEYVAKTGIDFLPSAVERLAISTLKLACLLHMHNHGPKNTKVDMLELLFAIEQAEDWIQDLLLMASDISASAFEERLNELEAYILQGMEHTRKDVEIRRQFANLRPREYDEIMMSLERQGRIRRSPHKDNEFIAFA